MKCVRQFSRIASCAAIRLHYACCANWQTPLNWVFVSMGIFMCGIYPQFSSNGAYPVVALMLLLSANSAIEHCPAQSFWSSCIIIQRTWPIDWLAHLIDPLVWGWNAMDMGSLVPISHCSSCQMTDVNFKFLSDTVKSGTPWSQTTSLRNSPSYSLSSYHCHCRYRMYLQCQSVNND